MNMRAIFASNPFPFGPSCCSIWLLAALRAEWPVGFHPYLLFHYGFLSLIEPTPAVIVRKKNKKVKDKLNCDLCDRVFKHRNSLVYHMRSHSGIRPHQCELCGKSFFASSALKGNFYSVLSVLDYSKCEVVLQYIYDCIRATSPTTACTAVGNSDNGATWNITLPPYIQRRRTTNASTVARNLPGSTPWLCIEEFTQVIKTACLFLFQKHQTFMTGERNYKCEYCGKTFRASSYLQNHRKIHTGEKPHNCSICSKPFRVRSDMKRHEKTHGKLAAPR